MKVFCDLELNYEAKINDGRNLALNRPTEQSSIDSGGPSNRAVIFSFIPKGALFHLGLLASAL